MENYLLGALGMIILDIVFILTQKIKMNLLDFIVEDMVILYNFFLY